MNNETNFTTVYSKGIVRVIASNPNPTFSHLLNVTCQTIGAEHKEKALPFKRVNFHSFRKYMEQTNGNGFNWYIWYMDNRANREAFNAAIAEYINHRESRTAIYVAKDSPLNSDRLLYNAITYTNHLRTLVNQ